MLRKTSLILATSLALIAACVFLTRSIPGFAAGPGAKQQPPRIKVLLIGGEDVAAHPAREICDSTRDVLLKSGKFDVRVAEDPMIFDSAAALKQYDVVAFVMYTARTPMISDQAKENLLAFVKGGKGFYVQHMASGSFAQWPEFGELSGRKWVMGTSGHSARSVFEAKIAKKEHPITKGMENFKVDDELYSKLQGTGEIEALVEADSTFSNKTEPLVFTLPYGAGRVAQNTFGHDAKAINDPNVTKLILRCVEWAATGKVAE
jgi:uncharacterized protein